MAVEDAAAEEAAVEISGLNEPEPETTAEEQAPNEPTTEIMPPVQQNAGPSLRSVDSDRQKPWDIFCSTARPVWRPPWLPRDNNDEREDYTGIFLCHARLYKFSDRYGCEKLMDLALQKLRLALSKYRVYPQRVSDVVELIRYTYAHTMDYEQRHDRLRALVLSFAVCYFHELVQHAPFLKLLQEGGPLPSDLVTNVADLIP